MAVVVLELDPKAADVAIDDVAFGDEIRAPDRVEDLLAGHDPPTAAGEQVQQALLDATEVDDRLACADHPVDDVDLHLAELDDRDDRSIGPRSPTADDDRAGQELLGREWRRQDVIHAEIEGPQLRLEVTAAGEAQDRSHAPGNGVRRPEARHQGGAVA